MDEKQISMLLNTDNFLNTLEKLLDSYDKKIEEYNKTLQDINDRLNSIDNKLETIEKNYVKDSDLSAISKDISAMKNSINSLKTKAEKNQIGKTQDKSKSRDSKLTPMLSNPKFPNNSSDYSNKSDFNVKGISDINYKKEDFTKNIDNKKDKKK